MAKTIDEVFEGLADRVAGRIGDRWKSLRTSRIAVAFEVAAELAQVKAVLALIWDDVLDAKCHCEPAWTDRQLHAPDCWWSETVHLRAEMTKLMKEQP